MNFALACHFYSFFLFFSYPRIRLAPLQTSTIPTHPCRAKSTNDNHIQNQQNMATTIQRYRQRVKQEWPRLIVAFVSLYGIYYAAYTILTATDQFKALDALNTRNVSSYPSAALVHSPSHTRGTLHTYTGRYTLKRTYTRTQTRIYTPSISLTPYLSLPTSGSLSSPTSAHLFVTDRQRRHTCGRGVTFANSVRDPTDNVQ